MRRTLALSLAGGILLVLVCGHALVASPGTLSPGLPVEATAPERPSAGLEPQGLKEKVHFPLYDSVTVPEGRSLWDTLEANSGILRFFVDVQGKSKLETNLGSSGVLPHFNTLEIFSLRVTVHGGYHQSPDGTPDLHGGGNLEALNSVLFHSVTSLYVGEKIMIQHPTFYFPSGGGLHAPSGAVATSGEPSAAAAFRLEEPVLAEKKQNFHVEIEFPDRDQAQRELSSIFGPARVWVTLDGFLTRTVQ
jgi:hypothetical protein